jgi:hypothetical protein
LAFNASSDKAEVAGSRALMRVTVWEYCLISRSLRLPKIFLRDAAAHQPVKAKTQF